MTKYRIFAVIILLAGLALGYFVYSTEMAAQSAYKFKYGLDLNGGTHLVYRADVTDVESTNIQKSMDVLKQTIEKRINVFGVSEPIIQTETGSSFGDEKDKYRLTVDLPGVTNIDEAVKTIGQTPLLEFKLARTDVSEEAFKKALESASTSPEKLAQVVASSYQKPVLTGGDLKRANLVFDSTSREPIVSIEFNDHGSEVFEKVTGDNVGKELAIFLDGQLISHPVIQQKISGGTAQINGTFTAVEARDLVNNLNFGALPLPIELISTQTIGATLGQHTLVVGAQALLYAFLLISIFMVLFYRLPGLIAVVSLALYMVIMLSLFKVIPVVITAAGIAGFVLSLGIAVDANVLIFERIKEELDRGKSLLDALKDGFDRAWSSIRDGNITNIIAAVILYVFSSVALIKGFALILFLGVVFSMFSALIICRTLIFAISKSDEMGRISRFLYSKGITNIKK